MRRGEMPLAVTPPPPPQRGSYLYGIHLHNGNYKTSDLPAKFVVVCQLYIVSIALNWNDSRGSTGIL